MPPAVLLLAVFLTLQTSPDPAAARVPPPGAASAVAVRADRPVVIDGKDDDPVWRVAPAITAFREFQPKEDGDPRFATEAKVAYDSRNFYVFIRAFDPHPDSILKLLARRDVRAATDQIKIIIDSYHDRRSGFEFAVNPAGVKRDYAIYNDGQTEDDAWDGVWEVATTVDSLGWTAEFRIPLSQLRYAPAATNTFGFGVWRDIQRYTERVSWPVYRASRPGFPSQMGEVQGLVGLSSPRRLEVTPYGVTKNVTVADGGAVDHPQRFAGGLDLGGLEGVPARETGPQDRTIEPLTNYAVVRAFQDLRHGESGVGVIATAVDRNLDVWTDPYLRQSAYAGAVDFRHRFPGGRYQLSGSLDLSRVAGTRQAIAATQQSSVHNYQRPDGSQTFDSTRTTLMGDAEELLFGKVGGGITRFETSYLRRSPGFEVNDLGFLQRADQQSWNNWFGLQSLHPSSFYQTASWNFNWWQYWAADGLALERAANSNVHVQLKNRSWLHAGATFGQLGTTFCDRCARGGPAVRADPYFAPWFEWDGDGRPPVDRKSV